MVIETNKAVHIRSEKNLGTFFGGDQSSVTHDTQDFESRVAEKYIYIGKGFRTRLPMANEWL